MGASASFQPTLGSLFNPMNLVNALQTLRHPPVRDIISGFDGVVRSGEMLRTFLPRPIFGRLARTLTPYIYATLVVLGRPGSGCSTFLKILANHRSGYHKIFGEVAYASLSASDIARHYRGDVQYCPEDDVHFPTLTVDQTVTFAAKTRTPQTRIENRKRSYFVRTVADIWETVFGLNHVKDTVVGDASVRGVSGGEKKRVS